MNSIPSRQNEPDQIRKLAAMRQAYSQAKKIEATRIIVAILIPIAVQIFAPYPPIRAYVVLVSIVAFIVNEAGLRPWKNALKTLAARIQESFDCYVLSLPWNRVTAASRPAKEDIIRYADRYEEDKHPPLRNWYAPAAGELNLRIGRVACQRVNCFWDGDIRGRYRTYTIVSLAALSAVVLGVGLFRDLTVQSFIIQVLAPLVPVYVVGIDISYRNGREIKCTERLIKHANQLWQEVSSGDRKSDLDQKSRNLQDEIYRHRRRTPLIFNWIYRLLWKEKESTMHRSVDQLVDERSNG